MADVQALETAPRSQGVGASAQPAQPQDEGRVLVNVPLDEPRGPGNFSDLALGEDVNLGEPSAPPEDYAPNLDDPFENTVAQMDYVVGFNDLFRLLAEPTIKIQYKR